MGRLRKSRKLGVWMNGEQVGEWQYSNGQSQQFVYTDAWLSSPSARPISLSMPLRPSRQPYREGVEAFFENLLPDNRQIRERIQRRFRTAGLGAFDLLSEIGRDCVGALQLLPEGVPPSGIRSITSEPLSRKDVTELLHRTVESVPDGPADGDDTFRISLAGAQEKTALLWRKGAWHRPTGATPTTHILKLPLGTNPHGLDLSSSVANEWLCSEIVQAYGLPVAQCSMETFGDFQTLVVERFDRRLAADGTWYLRLPQEDLCQATGTPPGLKYESDGGPGIARIMELLLGSEESTATRRRFLRTQVVFWLLAAIDGHAKNFSVFLLPGGAYRSTPLYDILSAYPVMGHGRRLLAPEKIRMAMAVQGKNRHYRWSEIQGRHWIETARRCGVQEMQSDLGELAERTPDVIRQVQSKIPRGFPASIAESILRGLQAASDRLKGEIGQS